MFVCNDCGMASNKNPMELKKDNWFIATNNDFILCKKCFDKKRKIMKKIFGKL